MRKEWSGYSIALWVTGIVFLAEGLVELGRLITGQSWIGVPIFLLTGVAMLLIACIKR